MSGVIKSDSEFGGLEIEIALSHRQDCRVYFDYVHLGACAGEIHRHDPHAQADAKNIGDVGGVGACEDRKHEGKTGFTLLTLRIKNVLDQIIVEVVTRRAVAPFDNLELAEMRIAFEQFNGPSVMLRRLAINGQTDC